MYLIAIAWFYVVLMMAVAEALSANGTVLGAIVTFVLYGLLPVSLLMYILGTPGRRRLRLAQEAAEQAAAAPTATSTSASAAAAAETAADALAAPDGGGHAPGAGVAAVREER